MIILGVLIILGGVIAFCRLLYGMATYALPLLVAVYIGKVLWAINVGVPAAIVLGSLAGLASLVVGHLTLTWVRHPLVWIGTALLFMAPAALAGYLMAYALSGVFHFPEWLRIAVAVLAATATGLTAIKRVLVLAQLPASDVIPV